MTEEKLREAISYELSDLYEAGLNSETLIPPGNIIDLCLKSIIQIVKEACLLRGKRELPDIFRPDETLKSGQRYREDIITPDKNGEYFGAVKNWV